jgi:hypothetical protein
MTAGSGLVILAILASFAIANSSSVVAQSSNPGLLQYLERVGQLPRLSKDCKLGNTPEFRMEARDFSKSEISDVLTRSPMFQKLVEADQKFSSGNFRGGFEKFGRIDMRPWLTTTNAQAVAHAIAGIQRGELGDYAGAVSQFEKAYSHADSVQEFPDALYFLGVARLAEGDSILARETWCFGIDRYTQRPGQSFVDPYWNAFIAGRLARLGP